MPRIANGLERLGGDARSRDLNRLHDRIGAGGDARARRGHRRTGGGGGTDPGTRPALIESRVLDGGGGSARGSGLGDQPGRTRGGEHDQGRGRCQDADATPSMNPWRVRRPRVIASRRSGGEHPALRQDRQSRRNLTADSEDRSTPSHPGSGHGGQAVAELGRGWSSRAVGVQRLHQRIHQVPVHPGQRRDRRCGPFDHGLQVADAFQLSRRMPGQQGVQGGGEGEDVAGLRGRRGRERLRGRIGGRHPQRVRSRCFVAHEGRQAEVRQSRSTEAVDQDVRRFHIAVQHSARVQAGQRVGDSQPHPPDLFLGADVLGNQPRGQRPTRAQLHDQVRPGVREQTGVVDGDDTGMIGQPAGDARLPGERLIDTRSQTRSIDLDRDGT